MNVAARVTLRCVPWLLTAVAAAALLLVLSIFAVPRLFGWELQVVLSGSMEPTYPVGSLNLVEPVQPSDVEVGMPLAYWAPSDVKVMVTHRVVEIVQQEDGLYFRTKGDANEDPDPNLVPADNVVGRVRWHIPYLGHIVRRLRDPQGFLLLMAVPAGLLVLGEMQNIASQLRKGKSRSRKRVPDERHSNVPVTHRVAEVVEQDGSLGLRTKGDPNDDSDIRLVTAADLGGRVRSNMPHLGDIAQGLRARTAFLALIVVPGGIILSKACKIFRQLRGGGQGGASASRPRVPGEPRKSRWPLWLTALAPRPLGVVVRALRRPAEHKAGPRKTATVAARRRWAWLLCALAFAVGMAALWVATSRGVFTHSETSYQNSMQVATDLSQEVAVPDTESSPPTEADSPAGEGAPEPSEVPIDDSAGGQGPQEAEPAAAEEPSSPLSLPTIEYQVQPGDTLTDIAARFGTTVEALVQLNGVQDPNAIFYGSTLSVPDVGGELGGATVGVSP
jgi:signal peptidase